MWIIEAGVIYFALVFGAGFVLGTIRTLWVAPRVGTRRAELMETPIMLAVTVLAARWVVVRLSVPATASARVAMGGIALLLLLFAEFGFMLWLRGLTIREYLANRDPVAGRVYYVMLAAFAAMPLLLR
jgi:type IV secretory pathway TrbD component